MYNERRAANRNRALPSAPKGPLSYPRSRDRLPHRLPKRSYPLRRDDHPREHHYSRHQQQTRYQETPVPSFESLKPRDTRWDVCVAKLQGMSARFAKASGVFPSPSISRVDTLTAEEVKELIGKQQKYEQMRRERQVSQNISGISNSKASKTVHLQGIDFDIISTQTVHTYLENFLASTVIPNVSYEDLKITTRVDGQSLIVECMSSLVATTLLSFQGKQIEEFQCTLQVNRPPDYIASSKPLVRKEQDAQIVDEIIETSSLICVNGISKESLADDLRKVFAEFGTLYSISILLDKLSYDSIGVAFINYMSLNENITYKDIFNNVKEKYQWNCHWACRNRDHRYFQSCDITTMNIKELVDFRTREISKHEHTSTIQILNVLPANQLIGDETDKQFNVFRNEVSQLRGFKDIKVIKPPKDVKSITPEEFVPEYGCQ
ncbi:hypothetical protein JL09_g3296 [Pichia kudriavzevii]|uniref:RRM domain-containing protein n=1 Tax=Pichia kudriavzevii TaxID=4909 RepID=A0A099P0D5_PICKU|nr:hypothetical protein JL09_g3296 [Pichia kudriavzevii]